MHLRLGENYCWSMCLEVIEKGSKSAEFEKVLSNGRGIHNFVFKNPRVGMMHQDGMQSGG